MSIFVFLNDKEKQERKEALYQAIRLRKEAGAEGDPEKYEKAAEIFIRLECWADATACQGAAYILRGAK